MKIRFCKYFNNGNINIIAEFDVAEEPTKEECETIENAIHQTKEDWEKEYGDANGFDYFEACYNAVQKYLKPTNDEIVKTIYL